MQNDRVVMSETSICCGELSVGRFMDARNETMREMSILMPLLFFKFSGGHETIGYESMKVVLTNRLSRYFELLLRHTQERSVLSRFGTIR